LRSFLVLTLALTSALAACQLHGKTICIDPGHPSEVGRGTRGKTLTEIQVVWDMALLMQAQLKKMGAKVVLTKSSRDQMVKNRDRSAIANKAKADLMVRLHCDAASGSGFATYYPTQQGTSQGKTGPSHELLNRIAPIAKRFHTSLANSMAGRLGTLGLKSDLKTAVGGRQGALTGSIFSEVPVLLVELVVLTNPKDEALMKKPDFKRKYAAALAKAIADSVGNQRP